MATEMRVDGIGIKAELEYEIGDFAVSGSIDAIYFETDIDAWVVTDDGLVETHATIRDFSVSPEAGVVYKINGHFSVCAAHIFDVGTKSRHGSGPISLSLLHIALNPGCCGPGGYWPDDGGSSGRWTQ